MFNKLNNIFYSCFVIVLFSSIISCQKSKSAYFTDLDNLYTTKADSTIKNSIAKDIEPLTKKALALKNTSKNATLIDSVLNRLRWTDEKEAFFKLTLIAEHDAKNENDNHRLANIYQNIAIYYHDTGVLDSVYFYYLKAEDVYKRNGDSLAVAENTFYQSRLLYELGLLMESKIKLTKSLRYLQTHTPKNPVLIEGNQLMAFHNMEQGDNQNALEYFQKTLDLLVKDEGEFHVLPQNRYYQAIANLYSNMAMLYNVTGDYPKAEFYATKGLDIINKNYTDLGFAFINTEYQLSKYYQGENQNIIEGIFTSYNIYKKLDHSFFVISTAILLSSIYEEQENREKALEWAWTAYNYAKESNFSRQQKEAIELILLYDSKYPYPDLVVELIDLNNQLEIERKETRRQFAKIEYETFHLAKQNESLKERIYIIIAIAGVVTLALGFLIFYLRLKNKNTALSNLAIQKSKNEKIFSLLIENNDIEHKSTHKERNRIAKDLHDGVINSVFTLRFNLQQMETPNKKHQESLIDELKKLESTVRDISHSLAKNSFFENNSFEKLLIELIDKQCNQFKTKFTIDFKKDLPFDQLSTLQRVNIYHILQETLQNVNKHSHATECKIKVFSIDNAITFSISDNGIGIKKNRINGLGLLSMRERAEAIKAAFNISSYQNEGTVVTLQIQTLVAGE